MAEASLIGGIGDWFTQRVVKIRRVLSPEDWTHVSLFFPRLLPPSSFWRRKQRHRSIELVERSSDKNRLLSSFGEGSVVAVFIFLVVFVFSWTKLLPRARPSDEGKIVRVKRFEREDPLNRGKSSGGQGVAV